jgi:hypothetical protein
MSQIHLLWAVALLYILILSPTITFLFSGWKVRRQGIIEGFSDAAIQSYFRAFHPQLVVEDDNCRVEFERYYKSQFGRARFLLPLILFATLAGLLLCWSALSIPDLLQTRQVADGKFPVLAIVAVMGAYMWVLFDETAKWYSSDISPGDIYWWCFRLVIAVPMGYAVKGIVTESLALPLAFFLGAFPTTQLMSIFRRIATRKMEGFADAQSGGISELQSLQGVDVIKAEQFGAESITTILELAYCDPIKLTIRTGLSYSFIVDCTCQALLWIYTEKETAALRKSGLRSAYEVLFLCLDLESDNPMAKQRAEQVIRDAAQALNRPENSVQNILIQVAIDPYTVFLFLSWSGTSKKDYNAKQQAILWPGK